MGCCIKTEMKKLADYQANPSNYYGMLIGIDEEEQ